MNNPIFEKEVFKVSVNIADSTIGEFFFCKRREYSLGLAYTKSILPGGKNFNTCAASVIG